MTELFSHLRFSGSHLKCVRGGRNVFEGLDFTLAAGDALLLLGPNGSGKSSLLRLMAGLAKPAAGTLAWNGQPIGDDREVHARRIHYVGHQDAIKPPLSVRENLQFWAGLHGGDGVDPALDAFGLAHLASTPAKYLSAGQKRRLGLARLMAAPAVLWLLDEPTVALDAASVVALEGLIAAHRGQGGMVALSTHAAIALGNAATLRLDAFPPARATPAELWA